MNWKLRLAWELSKIALLWAGLSLLLITIISFIEMVFSGGL